MSERRMWPTPNAHDAMGPRSEKNNYSDSHYYPHDLVTAVLHPDRVVPTSSTQLTLFAEAFPASRTVWLADVPAPPTSATSGRSSPDSFASVNPDGSWRKTCQGYCQVMLDGSLARFSETWPRAGMTRNGTAYRLRPSAPLTKEIGSGSLPTPRVAADRASRASLTAKHFSAPSLMQVVEIQAGILPREYRSLEELPPAARAMWPTPCAEDAKNVPYQKGQNGTRYPMLLGAVAPERMWPTPSASEDKYRLQGSSQQSHSLNGTHGGQLNPTFVEWLMGYPKDWTAV